LCAFGSGKVKNSLPRAPLIAGFVLMLVSAQAGIVKKARQEADILWLVTYLSERAGSSRTSGI
jgi:hypothetical protein